MVWPANEQFANRNRITLVNGAELKQLIKKHLNMDVIPGTSPNGHMAGHPLRQSRAWSPLGRSRGLPAGSMPPRSLAVAERLRRDRQDPVGVVAAAGAG